MPRSASAEPHHLSAMGQKTRKKGTTTRKRTKRGPMLFWGEEVVGGLLLNPLLLLLPRSHHPGPSYGWWLSLPHSQAEGLCACAPELFAA
jgi:hypothetical protein